MSCGSYKGPHNHSTFTPVPNHLIDDIMPTLTDTQWRVLCVVARQTLGWKSGNDEGQRKQSDWLTHRQLKYRTQRGNTAICQAVDVLVRRGLLIVVDRHGKALATPQERRRCGGKLYYRLAPHSMAARDNATLPTIPQSGKVTPQSGRKVSTKRFPESGNDKRNSTQNTSFNKRKRNL